MAANIENMFYTRETPWHGLGTRVEESPNSKEALTLAGLDWKVVQEPIYTSTKEPIIGYQANIRDLDRKVLGVVTNRYKVIQNHEAFAFTDSLLGEGVRYETAGIKGRLYTNFKKQHQIKTIQRRNLQTILACRMPR